VTNRVWLVAALLLCTPPLALAGSTEPELAIADVTASVNENVVTLEIRANYDYPQAMRLGYPVVVVATQGNLRTDLFLDGRVTLSSGGPATPLPNAAGVVAIAPTRITAVLPSDFTAGGSASVRLEATFDGNVLRTNGVEVQW
jgi:hypothetical protein